MDQDPEPSQCTWVFTFRATEDLRGEEGLYRGALERSRDASAFSGPDSKTGTKDVWALTPEVDINTRPPVQEARGQQHRMEFRSAATFPRTE